MKDRMCWALGLIGGAGLLAALVPGSMLLLAIATQLARNLIGFGLAGWDEEKLNLLARALVPLIALAAIAFEWLSGKGIVVLLLLGYGFVTQLLPALLASLLPRNPVPVPAVWAGAGVGVGVVALLYFGGSRVHHLLEMLPRPWRDLNYGILALALNALILLLVSAIVRPRGGHAPLPAGTGVS